ncbi:MAG: hypothetical protein KC503_45650 [Myxococcales bacterium]|nr:hypothetical protein [Myxococcales bacterium]
MYIATSSTLYRLDRLPPTKIGDFVLPQPQPRWEFVTQGIRDIAVDSRGRIFGLTHHHLYAVDPKTARLTHIGPTSDAIDDVERISNISVIIHQGRDLLIGVNDKAKVFEIDPATAARKQIAEIGGGCGEIAWTSGRLLTLISSPSPGSGPCVAAVDLDRGSSSCIAPLDEWPHSLTSYWGTPMALVGDEMAALHPMTMQLLPSRAPLQLGKPVVAIASGVK